MSGLRWRLVVVGMGCLSLRAVSQAQDRVTLEVQTGQVEIKVSGDQGPPSLKPDIWVLYEPVVTEQWAKTLATVNPPERMEQLRPGQCVRVGVIATGKAAAAFLGRPEIEFTVHSSGVDSRVLLAPAQSVKGFKPAGGDLVQGALNAGKVKFDMPIMTAVASSEGHWCVPADAAAGSVSIDASTVVAGKRTTLKPVRLEVVTPEHAGRSPLDQKGGIEDRWMRTYYRHPQPEWLLQVIAAIFEHDESANAVQQFVISAMKRDPLVIRRLGTQLSQATPQVQAMAVKLEEQAGVVMQPTLALSPMQKEFIEQLPNVPDPFHPTLDVNIGTAQDMLWSMFMATGDRAPVDSIIAMLAWRADYENFEKLMANHTAIKEVTPAIARAVAYTSAGWSLASFERDDPLVADYIAATLADAKTPEAIKAELRGLHANPAFRKK